MFPRRQTLDENKNLCYISPTVKISIKSVGGTDLMKTQQPFGVFFAFKKVLNSAGAKAFDR